MGPVWSLSQTQDETMPCLPVPWEGRPSGHCWQLMDSIFPLAGPPADCVILACLITTLRPDRLRNSIENSSLFADENHSPHKSQKLTLGGDWMNAAGVQRQHSAGEIQYSLWKEKLVICVKRPELEALLSAGTMKLQAFVFFKPEQRRTDSW